MGFQWRGEWFVFHRTDSRRQSQDEWACSSGGSWVEEVLLWRDERAQPGWRKGRRFAGGDESKKNKKHVTTYQHTLAEGSSTPASCLRGRPPSPDPPAGTLGSRRRWGRRPHRTAGLSWCCRQGFQGPRMAPGHILEKKQGVSKTQIHLHSYKKIWMKKYVSYHTTE